MQRLDHGHMLTFGWFGFLGLAGIVADRIWLHRDGLFWLGVTFVLVSLFCFCSVRQDD